MMPVRDDVQRVLDRRAFFALTGRVATGAAVAGVASLLAARFAGAQVTQSAASNVEMNADAYKPVRRPPKPGATPQMDRTAIEAFERNLACPCPCTLDVYSCRTTDLNCGISPAVHGDVQALVDGGYSASEIMAAMTATYGDFILMTPRKQGFNLLAWFAPFAMLGIGAVAIGALLRGWRSNARYAADARASNMASRDATIVPGGTVDPGGTDATPEELARLDAALRGDA